MVQKIFSRMKITRILTKLSVALLLENLILMVEVCFSNGDQNVFNDDCDIRGRENCYFVVSNGARFNWEHAHGKCKEKNYFLPVIRNREEQRAFETYLRGLKSEYPRINAVWTAGKREIYNDWTWNNGQTLSNAINISNGYSAEETHMSITWWSTETGHILRPERPLIPSWYLCQYKDRQCNGQQHEVNATNGCLIPGGYGNVNWYEARYDCLSKGGDLAILTEQDLRILKNHRFPNSYNYWIGLRKVNWVWKTNSQTSPEEDVKYTKWRTQSIPNEGDLCISIDAYDGQWRASRCSYERLPVICEKRGNPNPSTAISSNFGSAAINTTTTQTTATSTPGISATTKATAGNSLPTTVRMADCINNHNDVSPVTVGLVLGIGAIVPLFVIIIILILIILNLKKKLRKMSVSNIEHSVETQQYQELQRPETYANASNDYAELQLPPK